jgi:phosphonatase-like hydrolase
MSHPSVSLVVLDLTGTTVQDTGQVADAFAAALSTYGVHVTAADIARVRGASKRDAIGDFLQARGVHSDRFAEVYTAFQEDLTERYARTARAVPHALETMAWLRGQGVRVALNTGFDRATTTTLLDALGWTTGVADVVVCGDEVSEGRPAAAMILKCMAATGVTDRARVANVGDTALDLRAGHRAGVGFNIGVLSGAHSRAVLEAEPHTHLIDSVASLPDVLTPA